MAEQAAINKQDTPSPKVGSPKSPGKSPSRSPQAAAGPAAVDAVDDGDFDSAILDVDTFSSTASVSSSILQYRTIKGRTYHSERHNSDYYAPNDERQNDSVDITHHYLTLLLGGKLYLAPIAKNIQRVLDVGTGTGIWAIDFADDHPSASITGTDLSPTQPTWVPPNVRFEVDDATAPSWTWDDNAFDFIHMRYLFGAIADWPQLFANAFRVCAPGGWVQSGEVEVDFVSDDGSVKADSALALWGRMCRETGEKIGRTFRVLSEGVQKRGMEGAGFVDLESVDYQLPVGGWPADKKLAEVGQFVRLTLENDLEGYSTFMWNQVLNWGADEYQMFLMRTRKELKDPSIHSYFRVRYVYGRKPATA
ncbi:S-adenosyl-L-methionine-dependent methyltransferase [Podospora aff. communis PSN243]|uniref:S-adenosyl-L-methionine-dependent methyltransferase n=1 Tax=Podospora aff. communis PSN243 TaxID=3040156 RepID=A0AAV9GLD9_9PEZI|nr:S-adenosyl-L-methionine-dependent methyltransferase [Podospora aff. communis PSN243]